MAILFEIRNNKLIKNGYVWMNNKLITNLYAWKSINTNGYRPTSQSRQQLHCKHCIRVPYCIANIVREQGTYCVKICTCASLNLSN